VHQAQLARTKGTCRAQQGELKMAEKKLTAIENDREGWKNNSVELRAVVEGVQTDNTKLKAELFRCKRDAAKLTREKEAVQSGLADQLNIAQQQLAADAYFKTADLGKLIETAEQHGFSANETVQAQHKTMTHRLRQYQKLLESKASIETNLANLQTRVAQLKKDLKQARAKRAPDCPGTQGDCSIEKTPQLKPKFEEPSQGSNRPEFQLRMSNKAGPLPKAKVPEARGVQLKANQQHHSFRPTGGTQQHSLTSGSYIKTGYNGSGGVHSVFEPPKAHGSSSSAAAAASGTNKRKRAPEPVRTKGLINSFFSTK
jgi:hypothetical protein